MDEVGGRTPETLAEVELPRVDARLEVLPEDTALVARCGEGARAALTQTLPKDACQTADITWSRVSGPELTQDSLSGASVSLATRDTGLDTLVGQSVVMQVTAHGGPGNEASLQHVLPITVEPFVRLRRRTEVPAASDTGLVGVSITLTNTTSCPVKDVSFVERLAGMTYVEGSAQYEGQPLEASWVDGVLTVKGLWLEGNGSGKLTYVARPHLVGDRRMVGEALLREVPISIRDATGPQVPDSGCGCTSSGPGPVLFALGALVAAVRRRRR
jgi:MYXO-CTERM domain-containing protein